MFGHITLLCIVATLGLLFSNTNADAAQDVHATRSYVVICSNLPNADKEANQVRDLSDPFLVIRNNGGTQIFRSPTQENTLSPVFQAQFDWVSNQVYTFEVRDEDSFNPDDSLGIVAIAANNLVGTHQLANPTGGRIQILQVYAEK